MSGALRSLVATSSQILAARPGVGSVVHTRPPNVVALAATGRPLCGVSHAANYFVLPGAPASPEPPAWSSPGNSAERARALA